MRLIDADAFLMDSIKERRFFIHREDALNDVFVVNTVYGDLKKALANMPTIDAVEVVRCKDCTNWGRSPFGSGQIGWCKIQGHHRRPEYYCASAKRKVEG